MARNRLGIGRPCCGGEECAVCATRTPNYFLLQLAGVTNASCVQCTRYNGTAGNTSGGVRFWLSPVYGSGCQWRLAYTSPCDTRPTVFVDNIWVLELLDVSGTWTVRLTLTRNLMTTVWEWEAPGADPDDCCIDLEPITLDFVSSDDTLCDFSGSTVTVWPMCDCFDCATDTGFEQLEAVVDGMTYNPAFPSGFYVGSAALCAALNDTWVADKDNAINCQWSSRQGIDYYFVRVQVWLVRTGADEIDVYGMIQLNVDNQYHTYLFKTTVTETDRLDCCVDLDGLVLDYVSSSSTYWAGWYWATIPSMCLGTYATMTLYPDC
jgi:hypothetical protein